MHERFAPSDKEYEFVLSFRGPNGNQFGETIPMKIKVVPNQTVISEKDEIGFYKLAIKLHDVLKLGKNFDECV